MPAPSASESASPSPSATAAPAPPALTTAPLTGELVPLGSTAHPSLAAKIDNHVGARPQVGLQDADLVFEELVEGGLTRYVAVWHSEIPAEIGPIRSIRPMDPDIVSPLGGIIAYSGGQQRFVALMRGTNVYNAIHGQSDTEPFMYRTRDKQAPHNVIVRAQDLVAVHADLAAPPQLFRFATSVKWSSAARFGVRASALQLTLGGSSHPSWTWDGGRRLWLRAQDGSPDLDSAGGQLSAVNVVVLRVPVSTGLGVPKTELIGSGEAWIATGGRVVHASWSKADRVSPIRLVDDSGQMISLARGNSWIELVPLSGSVQQVP